MPHKERENSYWRIGSLSGYRAARAQCCTRKTIAQGNHEFQIFCDRLDGRTDFGCQCPAGAFRKYLVAAADGVVHRAEAACTIANTLIASTDITTRNHDQVSLLQQ